MTEPDKHNARIVFEWVRPAAKLLEMVHNPNLAYGQDPREPPRIAGVLLDTAAPMLASLDLLEDMELGRATPLPAVLNGHYTPREEALIASLAQFTGDEPTAPVCGKAWRAAFAAGELFAKAAENDRYTKQPGLVERLAQGVMSELDIAHASEPTVEALRERISTLLKE